MEVLKLSKNDSTVYKNGIKLIKEEAIIYGTRGYKRRKHYSDNLLHAIPALDEHGDLIFKCHIHNLELVVEQVAFEPEEFNEQHVGKVFIYGTCPECVKLLGEKHEYYDCYKGPSHLCVLNNLKDNGVYLAPDKSFKKF